jgi:hypothetical protein
MRNKTKKVGGMVQMMEHLPSKCKAFSSNPITEKEKYIKKRMWKKWEFILHGLIFLAKAELRSSFKTFCLIASSYTCNPSYLGGGDQED